MTNLKIVIPILVLGIKILMKFLVGRKTEHKYFFELFNEIPTDIIFLSFSFSLVYFFLDEVTSKDMALIPIALVGVSLVVVAIFRGCRFLSEGKLSVFNIIFIVFLVAINYYISVYCLTYTMGRFPNRKADIKTEQNLKNQNIKECK